jgi:hypothetical protein
MTSWPVTIDIGALGMLPASLLLNLPGRDAVTLTRDTSENRGAGQFLWTGRGGDCNVVLDATTAGLRGVLSCLNANYGISGDPDALQLDRHDPNPLGPPAGTEEVTPPITDLELANVEADVTHILSPLQTDTVIDVLVLYQEPVRAALDPHGGSVNTYAFARLCVETLQQAMTASLAPAQVHMVAAKKVSRTAYGNITADYAYLRDDPEPRNLRNFWAADVVMYLMFSGGQYYGTSLIPGYTAPPNAQIPPPGPNYAPLALAVVQYNTAILDTTHNTPEQPYVFMHEFAHVIGANHNHEDSPNTTPLEQGAFGYWMVHAKKGSDRTILANPTPQCNAAGACTRVMYYSNPAVTIDGWFHTGVAGYADNAKLITDYWSYVPQYRQSLGRIFYDGFDDP